MRKKLTLESLSQPPQQRLAKSGAGEKDTSNASAVMLSGIALFSLVVVAGVTVWQNTTPDAPPAQFVAAPAPEFDRPSTEAPISSPAVQPSVAPVIQPTQTVDTIRPQARPEQPTQTASAPRLPQNIDAPAPVLRVPERSEVEPPANASARLAIVDESTGTVHELDMQDLQRLSYDAPEGDAIEDTNRVTRLDTQSLTSKSVAATNRTPTGYTCVDALRAIAAKSTVFFYTSGAELTPRAIGKIRKLGSALERCPQAVVQVNGHSDASGDEALNMAISWQRADNAIAALASLGFDTSRLDPVGFGSSLPLAEGDTSPELDRRVEFQVMEKK